MKLLFCPKCWDVKKLAFEERRCACGESYGRYIDRRRAVIGGEAVLLGINNFSLRVALGVCIASGARMALEAWMFEAEHPNYEREVAEDG